MRLLPCITLALLVVPAVALAEGVDLSKLDDLHARREDPAVQKELDTLLPETVKANPDDAAVLWRAARNVCWHAGGTTNEEVKKKLSKECWALAERSIKADPKQVEGHYWAAVGIGSYSEAAGILTALGEGLEGKFNDRLDVAIKMDPGLNESGPVALKGRYFFSLPWPKRDLGKAQELLKKAIEKSPAGLRAYVYLAEAQLRDGKAKLAKETIAKALSGATDYDHAEGARAKEMAKKISAEIDKELK